jgi:hypothetical protein
VKDMMVTHPTFEQLSELADGSLGAAGGASTADRERVERHIASCDTCRTQVESVRQLLAEADDAAESIDPPEDLWLGIREELERRKVVALPGAGGSAESRRDLVARRRMLLGIAAVVLVTASSALTAAVMQARASQALVAAKAGPAAVRVLPASLVATEAGFLRTAQQLQASLDEQRDRLSPATIATVEHSLQVIDQAIAEAREALLSDPHNQALVDMFATNYERKLDLLRRATELAPRS